MRTCSVFTAEIIKVVRAGLDKERNKVGDVLRERIFKFMMVFRLKMWKYCNKQSDHPPLLTHLFFWPVSFCPQFALCLFLGSSI